MNQEIPIGITADGQRITYQPQEHTIAYGQISIPLKRLRRDIAAANQAMASLSRILSTQRSTISQWSRGLSYDGWPSDDDRPHDILDQIDAAITDYSRPANPDQPWPYTSF